MSDTVYKFPCNSCEQKLSVIGDQEGKLYNCPTCSSSVTVPALHELEKSDQVITKVVPKEEPKTETNVEELEGTVAIKEDESDFILFRSVPLLMKGIVGDYKLWILPLLLFVLWSAAFDSESIYALGPDSDVSMEFWFWVTSILIVVVGYILASNEKLAVYTKWNDDDDKYEDLKQLAFAFFAPLVVAILLAILIMPVCIYGFGLNSESVGNFVSSINTFIILTTWICYLIADFSVCYYRNRDGLSAVVAYITKLAVPALIILLLLASSSGKDDKNRNNSAVETALAVIGIFFISSVLVKTASEGSHAYQAANTERAAMFNYKHVIAIFIILGIVSWMCS